MSFPPHNSPPAEAPPLPTAGSEPGEYSLPERATLLKLAHASIQAAAEGRELRLESPSAHLAEPRGVFTTIYLQRELRGCVGYVFPVAPLYRAVAETARAAASEDTRFLPVSRDEAYALEVSLSVLSPLQPIEPAHVEIGRHGLMMSMAGHRGLLLPQVPIEHHWDRITFLEQTCRKAGLPLDAWKMGATLEAFTAEVFGESELAE
jgi:AmmeMemoRadiSam system protein A